MISPFYLLRNQLIKRYPYFQGCAPCPHRPLPWHERSFTQLPIRFPIDIVYTWVDGDDPSLQKKRSHFLPAEQHQSETAHGKALFRCSDELRYSLRSIAKYAPWVNHIFLVTDNQVPPWLAGHPNITVVDHTEIIPKAYLPTFNSRVIEAFLHRIPSLSEHYIYCNDDVFFCAPCPAHMFFTSNGLPFIFTDWRATRQQGYARADTPHSVSFHLTRQLLKDKGYIVPPELITAHVPFPQTKTHMEEAHSVYRKSIESLCTNKFRSSHEITLSAHGLPFLAFVTRKAVPCDMPYYYINTKRFDRSTYYTAMLHEKDTGTLPPFFCLNDAGDAPPHHTWQYDMQRFLTQFFPDPSPYEKLSAKEAIPS